MKKLHRIAGESKNLCSYDKKNKIKQKLSEFSLKELGKETKFHMRDSGKIDAESFVLGFFRMMAEGKNTLFAWAMYLSIECGKLVTPQAIHARLQNRHVPFAKRFLEKCISRLALSQDKAQDPDTQPQVPPHLQHFRRVYVEDSTCVKLPANVQDVFPGNRGRCGSYAQARIQLTVSLLEEKYARIQLTDFRHNDQSYAFSIVDHLESRDLVIRDLGYWSIEALQAIAQKGAFFLSRLKYGPALLDPQTEQPLDLPDMLARQRRKGQWVVDMNVWVGKEARMPARLVAVQVPREVYQQRLRKLAKDRDKRRNPSKAYKQLLGWDLFVTNVPAEVWTWQDVLKVYGYRWRIESIFKSWKGKMHLKRLFEGKQSLTPSRVLITLYLFLAWACLFFNRYYNYFRSRIHQLNRGFVSMLKFAEFFSTFFEYLIMAEDLDQFIDHVCYYCLYDKRRDRSNFMQSLYVYEDHNQEDNAVGKS